MEKVADFLRREEAFDRVAAEVRQRRVVEVGLDQRAFCQEDFLNGTKTTYLVGVVVMGLAVLLEAALHHLVVIGESIKCEQVPEERKEIIHAQPVGNPDISAGQLDVVAAEFALECALQVDKL